MSEDGDALVVLERQLNMAYFRGISTTPHRSGRVTENFDPGPSEQPLVGAVFGPPDAAVNRSPVENKAVARLHLVTAFDISRTSHRLGLH